MISTHYELTDMGKRQLLRELSYELTDKKIAEIVAQFADCLKVDRHGDALLEIDGNDIINSVKYGCGKTRINRW